MKSKTFQESWEDLHKAVNEFKRTILETKEAKLINRFILHILWKLRKVLNEIKNLV
jgi:hypothetical protein